MSQLNCAFYSFAPLTELEELRVQWLSALKPLSVKGTIILAPEGVNGFLAGPPPQLQQALACIRATPALATLRTKDSFSDSQPFEKLTVKIKPEIVTFRIPGHTPLDRATKRILPEELARWFAEGREFLTLDTRNEYEVRLGTFTGAHSLGVDHFVDFAEAAAALPEDWKRKPVVTFCTGGIRCEKAAPYLESLGFANVMQLEGGILNYFEKVGGAHWQGECFVFDQRVALGPDLAPTGAHLCSECQGPVPQAAIACIHCGAAR